MARTRVDAQGYADKWSKRTKAAGPEMRAGVERVTEAPGKRAAAAQDRMRAGILASLDDGTWAKQVAGVSLEDWRTSMIKKGLVRVASGVDTATPGQVAMAQKLLAAVDASMAEVEAMPKATLDDRLARMDAFARAMNKRKIRRPS